MLFRSKEEIRKIIKSKEKDSFIEKNIARDVDKKKFAEKSKYNSEKIIEIFKGADNDFSVAVSLNAAAGLIVSGKSEFIGEAYSSIRKHILSGKAFEHLNKITNF